MENMEFDEVRENRIKNEITVDAVDKEDRAMGWYYYLDECLNFPFNAKWTKKGRKGTTPKEKVVEVVGMAMEDECMRDMVVEVVEINGSEEDVFTAKLKDLQVLETDEETMEALSDWYYWLGRGYKF